MKKEKKRVDINIIIENKNADIKDEQLFFGSEQVMWLPDSMDMVDILVQAGVFPSKGQARKNGWANGREKIKEGFTETTVGKLKHKITIFNATEPWE